MKKILLFISLLVITSSAFSQNYPVQSTVVIIPPYSVYLSDYASISSNKLMVNLLLKDRSEREVSVTLRFTIKGNGIEIKTRDDYRPGAIQLQGGVLNQLMGSDIENYLNPENLTFSGITKNQFIKTGKLPEGVYQFIVEAISFDRPGVVLSNQGISVGWLILNDPPRWTLPVANTILTATYPQNVFFSWVPMSTGSPNAAFTTEYEFTLVELWPDNRAPGDAINSVVPLYQTTTKNTSLVFGPGEPELTPGHKYVCRLRAYDTEGRDLFKNKGYSEILVFTFGRACKPPTTMEDKISSPEEARVSWTSLPGQTQFALNYSEQNDDGTWSNWYTNETMMPWSDIKALKPEHTYRYQLKATCGTLESELSEIKEFKTPKSDTAQIACGKNMSIPKIDNSPPLDKLQPGNQINAGGFKVIVAEAEGSNGVFSGKGIALIKTFGYAPILCEFQSIGVNKSMQLTNGSIKSVKGELNIIGLDAIVQKVEDKLNTGDKENNQENSNNNSNPNVGEPYNPGDMVTIVYDGQTFTTDKDTIITLADGKVVEVKLSGQPPVIEADGKTTEVTSDKLDFDNPGTVAGTNATRPSADSSPYSINYVEFKAYNDPNGNKFGFDAFPPNITQIASEYKEKEVLKKKYIVPWQSVEADGRPALVNMLIQTKVPDSIQTRLKVEMKGMPLTFTASPDGDTIKILNLVGQGNKDEELITANYINDKGKEIPVGYLNLISYQRQTHKLVIMPVDGKFNYSEAAVQNYLNKVYSPAITSWTVGLSTVPLDVAYDEGETNGLNTSRSFLSSFNKEMKAIINAMEKRGDYDKDVYYLFVMDKAENESLNGLMPFGSHYGFLFTGDNPAQEKLFRTMAHELGHGAFKLKHIFDDKGTDKQNTQNLMDYTITPETATVLHKYQWDEIIDPRLIAFGWSEEKYAEENSNVQGPPDDIFIQITELANGLGLKLGVNSFVIVHVFECYYADQLQGDPLDLKLKTYNIENNPKFNNLSIKINTKDKGDKDLTKVISIIILFEVKDKNYIPQSFSKIQYLPPLVPKIPFLGIYKNLYQKNIELIDCSDFLNLVNDYGCINEKNPVTKRFGDEYKGIYISHILDALNQCIDKKADANSNDKIGDNFLKEQLKTTTKEIEIKQLEIIADKYNKIGDIIFKSNNSKTWESFGDYFRASYNSFKSAHKEVKKTVDNENLEDYPYDEYITRLQKFIGEYQSKRDIITKFNDEETVSFFISTFTSDEITYLPMDLRVKLLDVLSNQDLRSILKGKMYQGSNLTSLLLFVKDNEIPTLLEELKKGKLLNNVVEEFENINTWFNNDYESMVEIIDSYSKSSKGIIDDKSKLDKLVELYKKNRFYSITKDDKGKSYITAAKILSNGEVTINISTITGYNTNGSPIIQKTDVKLPFDEPIALYHNAYLDGVDASKVGKIEIVSALKLHYYLYAHRDENIKTAASITFDVATLAIGVGEISAGIKGIRFVIAICDVASSVTSLLATTTKPYLITKYGQKGKEYVESMQKISAVLGFVDIGASGLVKLKSLLKDDIVKVGKFYAKNSEELLKASETKEIAEETKKIVDEFVENDNTLESLIKAVENTDRKYIKGLTDAHYDKIDEVLGDKASAFINEIVDNPLINVGSVDEIETLAKTKKWRLKPNDTYIENGYTYKTDKYGRIESAEGNLKLDGAERHPDGPSVGEGDGKLTDDVGGHLIGRQYGGAGDARNVVPMDKTVNAYSNTGKFGQHEIRWRRLLTQNPATNINIKIEQIFNQGNYTIRADAFRVIENIDGVEMRYFITNN